jgi:hypothetical protein
MDSRLTRPSGLALLALLTLLSLGGTTGRASGYSPGCGQVPIFYGTPPWGFRTSPGSGYGSFARGHGDIDLAANTVSGVICQEDRRGAITMTLAHHLLYHSHYATMWNYPGNIMRIVVRVVASNDPHCTLGTVGRATLFASYNGVRSDSDQFFFPAACRDQDYLYHGPQVNYQVPPQ